MLEQYPYTQRELDEAIVFEAGALATRVRAELLILDRRIDLFSPFYSADRLIRDREKLRKYLDLCEEFHTRLMHGELT